jgi:single-strand DNA-binding protein
MAKNPNIITIRGRLTADPELRSIGNGASVCNIRIASNGSTKDRNTNEWHDEPAVFFRCVAWREIAENISRSLTKGSQVVAIARPRSNTYQSRTGENVTTTEWVIEDIGASMQRATLAITPNPKRSGFAGARREREPEPPKYDDPADDAMDTWNTPTDTDDPEF